MTTATVRLSWLPLGAGGRSVRWNGRVFEAVVARAQHRRPCDLYHAALEIRLGQDHWVLEMAPAWSRGERGVTVTGPVGLAALGRSVLFRYEVRLWPDGVIPDLDEAVGPPTYVATEPVRLRRLIDGAGVVPALTWGRDELGLGEMWTSNSVVSWLLATSGHVIDGIGPPPEGRAPGWDAGRRLAARAGSGPGQKESAPSEPRGSGITS